MKNNGSCILFDDVILCKYINSCYFGVVLVLLKAISLVGLLIYFAVLLIAVTKEKKNHTVEDYFFAGRTLPFWALSITL